MTSRPGDVGAYPDVKLWIDFFSMSEGALELSVRTALADGDTARATTLALQGRGPEVLRFLRSLLGDEARAGDAFSLFAERLWSTLPRFEWQCSLRSWCFLLARHAATDQARGERRHVGEVPLSQAGELAERLRTETTSDVDRARTELRASFSEEERTLLILRLEEGLAWRDLARVFLGERATAEELDRESARLRKRFQLAKDRFVEAAKSRGLLR